VRLVGRATERAIAKASEHLAATHDQTREFIDMFSHEVIALLESARAQNEELIDRTVSGNRQTMRTLAEESTLPLLNQVGTVLNEFRSGQAAYQAGVGEFTSSVSSMRVVAEELRDVSQRQLAYTEATSTSLDVLAMSLDAFQSRQQEFQAKSLDVWRDATSQLLDSLTRTFDNAQRSSSQNEVPDEISVSIYLDSDDPSTVERVVRYVDDFIEQLGYEGPVRPVIEHGSFVRRSLARMKVALTSDEVRDLVAKAERVVEVHYLDSQQADVDSKVAEAVSNLIAALADVPTACIRAGTILFIKYSGPEGPVVLSKSLTPREVKTLERYPGIQREPDKVLEYLALTQASLTEP
jgi:hypothetical protein